MILNRLIRAALDELAAEIERLTRLRYQEPKPYECRFISIRQIHEAILFNRGMEAGLIYIQTLLEKSIIGRIL